jgi:hypothetical protein
MKLKLLKVLTEEIEEQGYGRYYTDVVLSSGVKIGDTRGYNFLSGNSINKSDKVITKVLSNYEEVDVDSEESTYGFEIGKKFPDCVGQGKVCYGGINGNWAGSMTRALEMASWLKGLQFKPGSQKRHTKNTASGLPSNHWKGSTAAYGVDLPCGKTKGDAGWKKLRDEFFSRGWLSKDRMSDKLLERGEGLWINFYVGDYKYQVGWNVTNHYDHIHVGVRHTSPSKVNKPIPVKNEIKKDEEVIKKDEKLIDTRLPKNIQDLMDKLKSEWKVVITKNHLDAEFKQEGNFRPDAGSVNSEALKKITKLIKDCKSANPTVNFPNPIKHEVSGLASGYRSYDEQVVNFGSKAKKRGIEDTQASNCLPGFSQHHTGRAFDIFSTETSWWRDHPKVKDWVANNCKTYGFEVTYKTKGSLRIAEPWHLYYK